MQYSSKHFLETRLLSVKKIYLPGTFTQEVCCCDPDEQNPAMFSGVIRTQIRSWVQRRSCRVGSGRVGWCDAVLSEEIHEWRTKGHRRHGGGVASALGASSRPPPRLLTFTSHVTLFKNKFNLSTVCQRTLTFRRSSEWCQWTNECGPSLTHNKMFLSVLECCLEFIRQIVCLQPRHLNSISMCDDDHRDSDVL